MPYILARDQRTTNSGHAASWRKAVLQAAAWLEETLP
jgi:hypothetical protein